MLAANGRYHVLVWIAAVLFVPFSGYWVYGHWTDRPVDIQAGDALNGASPDSDGS